MPAAFARRAITARAPKDTPARGAVGPDGDGPLDLGVSNPIYRPMAGSIRIVPVNAAPRSVLADPTAFWVKNGKSS